MVVLNSNHHVSASQERHAVALRVLARIRTLVEEEEVRVLVGLRGIAVNVKIAVSEFVWNATSFDG